MLPLPSDIQESSPESSPLGRGIEDEEEEASELERDLMSLEEPLAPKAQERNKRRLYCIGMFPADLETPSTLSYTY